ncbi:zinc-dependent metalloprotease [Thalassotalea crassostreae]|uniref:zinc-dependent metalloprotease n=1 Tax=Thalassotalea crassostreae TaxID=1763536 RepID=UPI00083945B1|nr:zinc-dependent metalloprotease [Thalassotalea crassostreae]
MKILTKLVLLLSLVQFSLPLMAAENIASFKQGKSHQAGFVPFYFDDKTGKVFVEISEFDQEFLFQSSMPYGVGSNDLGLDRGQLGDTRLVKFERIGNKVFLHQMNTYYRAITDNELERKAIDEAFASSIIWGFDVVLQDGDKTIIDYTPFLLTDIHGLADRLKAKQQGSFSIDKSRSAVYQKRSKAFVDNTELEAVITFTGKGTGQYIRSVTPDANAITVHLHHSLIRLPDNKYQVREFHPFSGMWSVEYADYASAIDQPLQKRIIPRHRLAKKDPKSAVSEAVEPIVYYLDPGVPEPVRGALLDGAKWWNQAFETAGYKDAFQVKMLPADADPMDVRYNVIQWVHRATRGWSYGASVVDPRTGEILKGHVTLGSLRVRQDYLIALGLTSPFKTDGQTDTTAQQEMALARIRQLSAHEVGHTLGIAHNFSASVNDRASVMDYPHPLVTLDNNGNIDLSNAYATDIGVWDKHVIEYAYGEFENEAESLAAIIKKAKAQGLLYMSDPDARPKSGADANGHLWDNGENAVAELLRVKSVRATALANFGKNSIANGTPFSELESALVPIYNFHRYQVEAAAKVVAGVNYQYAVKGEDETIVDAVSAEQQTAAIDAILSTIDANFLTLDSNIINLIPPKAYGYSRTRESFSSNTGLTFDPVTAAQASAKHSLSLLLNSGRLARLSQQNAMNSEVPSVSDLLARVTESTFKQQHKGLASLVQQRINQQTLDLLISLQQQESLVPEVRAQIYKELTNIQSWLKANSSYHFKTKPMYAHYVLLQQQIAYALQQGKAIVKPLEVKLPPGSPIGS